MNYCIYFIFQYFILHPDRFGWLIIRNVILLSDKLLIYRENFERAYIEATEQFYSVKAPEQLGAGNADNGAQGVYSYMRYAESKLREEEQRAQKYLETSLCTTVNPSITISVGTVNHHQGQQATTNTSSPSITPQPQLISNGGGVVAAGIGTANGLNSTNTSGSVQNLVDSCVVCILVCNDSKLSWLSFCGTFSE